MLRNCRDVFIMQCASRKFLDTLEDVLQASKTSPVVRERLLDVLAGAAYMSPSGRLSASCFSVLGLSYVRCQGVVTTKKDFVVSGVRSGHKISRKKYATSPFHFNVEEDMALTRMAVLGNPLRHRRRDVQPACS